jgi:hypothetical protein
MDRKQGTSHFSRRKVLFVVRQKHWHFSYTTPRAPAESDKEYAPAPISFLCMQTDPVSYRFQYMIWIDLTEPAI